MAAVQLQLVPAVPAQGVRHQQFAAAGADTAVRVAEAAGRGAAAGVHRGQRDVSPIGGSVTGTVSVTVL